jgi:hypothetical protein
MVTNSFDDGDSAGIADAKAFAGHATEKGTARSGAVKTSVSDDDIFL